jgi:hypothetical protein
MDARGKHESKQWRGLALRPKLHSSIITDLGEEEDTHLMHYSI